MTYHIYVGHWPCGSYMTECPDNMIGTVVRTLTAKVTQLDSGVTCFVANLVDGSRHEFQGANVSVMTIEAQPAKVAA